MATINSFHEALYCISSRLENIGSLNRNEDVLEQSRRNVAKQSSLSGCYGNQNNQKRTKLDRNERNQLSRPSEELNSSFQEKPITFLSLQLSKQSYPKTAKKIQSVNKIQNKKQTRIRRCQKNSIDYTTCGQIHHRICAMTKERRAFWTPSEIALYQTQTNSRKRRKIRRHCNAQGK